jgi:hypothetical protein
MLSVSRLHSADDRKINEYGAVGEMRIGGRNRSTRKNPPRFHFVHHKPQITWPGIDPGPQN